MMVRYHIPYISVFRVCKLHAMPCHIDLHLCESYNIPSMSVQCAARMHHSTMCNIMYAWGQDIL